MALPRADLKGFDHKLVKKATFDRVLDVYCLDVYCLLTLHVTQGSLLRGFNQCFGH